MGILTPYYDGKLKLSNVTPARITAEERRRLSRMLKVVEVAQTVPRRLGPTASPEEMAADKRKCRRVAHALRQPLESWGGPVDTDDLTAEAAQLNWKKWVGEEQSYLNNRMKLIATLGVDQPEHKKWARKAFTKLQNEARWVEHAIR